MYPALSRLARLYCSVFIDEVKECPLFVTNWMSQTFNDEMKPKRECGHGIPLNEGEEGGGRVTETRGEGAGVIASAETLKTSRQDGKARNSSTQAFGSGGGGVDAVGVTTVGAGAMFGELALCMESLQLVCARNTLGIL